jgi:hypothetical protein
MGGRTESRLDSPASCRPLQPMAFGSNSMLRTTMEHISRAPHHDESAATLLAGIFRHYRR